MKEHQSFLIFLLAFAALTLARGQAMAQWDWDWGDLPPGFIDGGSTNLVYTCTQSQDTNPKTNTLTLATSTTPVDVFESDDDVSCNFGVDSSGVHRGVVQGTDIQCHYNVTWTGNPNLVNCVDTKAGAVVTVKSTCDNPNVIGSLQCGQQDNNQGGTFTAVIDLLGISSKSECQRVFGRNANTLFTQATFTGQKCSQVLNNDPSGLKLGSLSQTTTHLCHSDGGSVVDCITPGGQTNKSNSAISNFAQTQCSASPQTWNVDCSGNKDNGNGTVCYINGASNVFSFDPTQFDATTATLNGVHVDSKKSCQIKDCNGDGVLDFQCTFPTCSGGEATAAGGELTMITSFFQTTTQGLPPDISGLTCTTQVGTSGQGS